MLKKSFSVVHIITSLESGGAQTSLHRLLRFSNNNIDNYLIVLKEENDFYDLSILNKNRILFLDIKSIYSLLMGLKKSILFIFKNNINILHSWLPHSDIFASFIKFFLPTKKVIWSIRYSELNRKNTKITTLIIIEMLKYLSFIIPSAIIFCSKRALNFYSKKGFYKKKLFLIYNSVDSAFLIKRDINQYKNNDDKLFTFGTLSRYHPIKDHITLFKAFALLPSKLRKRVKLLLAGKGLDKENLELMNLIKKYIPDIKVELYGEIKNVDKYLLSLNIFTLSSLSEGFPNVLAESMALGIPCISTDAGDAYKIIGEHGWIVPIKNSIKFSEAILLAYELSPQESEELSFNAKKRIKLYFSEEKYVNSHFELYESLL